MECKYFVLQSLCVIVMLLTSTRSARILAVFPTASISHQVVFRPITQELVKRGHEVVIITPDPAFSKQQRHQNMTEIDVHKISYSIWNKFIAPAESEKRDWLEQTKVIIELFQYIFEEQMKSEDIKDLLLKKDDYFDLLLLEACVKPALGFSHIFKAPVIQVSSFGLIPFNIHAIGASSHPFLYPDFIRDRLYNLTMWEKLVQLKKVIQYRSLLYTTEQGDNRLIRKIFGKNVPTLEKLSENIEMVFINIHPLWDNNRPVPPSVIYIGGLDRHPKTVLSKELKSYLDASKNGVIYFSLGTNVKPSLLPPGKLQLIINVLARLPYNVLMKWDNEELHEYSSNIKVSKWYPQFDILRHPKVKLFITQGGLRSTEEAIEAGVPLIGIPMMVDQWYNVEKYMYYKIGLKLDIHGLEEQELEKAIKTVIEDKSYGKNIVKLRELMQDQPQKPLDRAIWWIEHVLRHRSARHLRSPTANMSWAEYLELKLILLLILTFSLSLIVLIGFVKLLVASYIKFGPKFKTKVA